MQPAKEVCSWITDTKEGEGSVNGVMHRSCVSDRDEKDRMQLSLGKWSLPSLTMDFNHRYLTAV